MNELGINQVTTAVRGRECEIEKKIEKVSEQPDVYTVECPEQKVVSTPTPQRHKARFDLNICRQCPLKDKCQIFKQKGRFYFGHEDYLLNRRNNNIKNIPAQRRKLRPNVEATMNQFKVRTKNGKIRVRGIFKTKVMAFCLGIAINFGRILNYLLNNGISGPFSFENASIRAKESLEIAIFEFLFRIKAATRQILTIFAPALTFTRSSSFIRPKKIGSF
jgi:hypothetical protein